MKLKKLMNSCVKINSLLVIQRQSFCWLLELQNSVVSYKVNDFVIEQAENIKFLGVVLNDKLSWKTNLKYLKYKLAKNCFIMSKLRYYFDISTLKLVYYILFYPHIQYCIPAWVGAASCHLKLIVSKQKIF